MIFFCRGVSSWPWTKITILFVTPSAVLKKKFQDMQLKNSIENYAELRARSDQVQATVLARGVVGHGRKKIPKLVLQVMVETCLSYIEARLCYDLCLMSCRIGHKMVVVFWVIVKQFWMRRGRPNEFETNYESKAHDICFLRHLILGCCPTLVSQNVLQTVRNLDQPEAKL